MKVLWCDSAVKRCMANMWIPSILQHSKKTYEIIIQVCLLLHSEMHILSYFDVFHSLCDFQLFLQAESDIL